MNLYLLRLDGTSANFPNYDVALGFVISAPDEVEAREWAAKNAGDEEADAWLEPRYSTCIIIARDVNSKTAGVILRDFNAG